MDLIQMSVFGGIIEEGQEAVEDVQEGAEQAAGDITEGAQDVAGDVTSPEVDVPDVQAPDVSAPSLPSPDVSLPDAPEVDVPSPEVDVPEFEPPDVQAPDVSLPDVETPDVGIPSAPDVSVPSPEVDVPDVQTPDVGVPDVGVPDISAPDVSLPDAPSLDDVDAPQVSIPESPEVDIPDAGDAVGAGQDVLEGAFEVGEGISQESFEAGQATGEVLRDVGGDVGQEIGETVEGTQQFGQQVGQGVIGAGRGVEQFAGDVGEGVIGAGRGVEDFFGDVGEGVLGAAAGAGGFLAQQVTSSPSPPQPPTPPGFSLGRIETPERVPVGERFEIGIPIENTGGSAGDVELQVGDQQDSATIEPGQRRVLRFDLQMEDPGVTRYPATITFPQSGESQEFEIPVLGAAPAYQFGGPSVPQQVPVGEEYTIEIPVSNQGNAPGEPTISVDGQRRSRQIQPGSTQAFAFTFPAEDPGVVEHEVTFENPQTGERATTTLGVPVVGSEVQIAELAYPDRVPQGQQYSGRIALVNGGGAPANVRVSVGNTTVTRTIPPGGNTVVEHPTRNTQTPQEQFTITVTNADTGEQIAQERVTVQTVTQPDQPPQQPPGQPPQPPQQPGQPPEEEPDQPEPGRPSIARVNYPSRATPGDRYTGRITVANDGGQPVQLRVSAGEFSRAITVDPGSRQTVEHRATKSRTGSDQYTVRVVNRQTGELVGSQEVTVRPEPQQEPAPEPTQPPQQPEQPPQQPAPQPPQPIVVQPPQQPAQPAPRQPAQPPQQPGDDEGITITDLLNPLFPLQVLLGEEP